MRTRNGIVDRLRTEVERAVRDGCGELKRTGSTTPLTIELWTGSPLDTEVRKRLDAIVRRAAIGQDRVADPVAFKLDPGVAFRIVGPGGTLEERRPASTVTTTAAPGDVAPDTDATRLLPRRSPSPRPSRDGEFLLRLTWNDVVSQHSLLPDGIWRPVGRSAIRPRRPGEHAAAPPLRIPAALVSVPSGWLLELCSTHRAVFVRRTGDREECAIDLDSRELPSGRSRMLAREGELRFTTPRGSTRLDYRLTRSGSTT